MSMQGAYSPDFGGTYHEQRGERAMCIGDSSPSIGAPALTRDDLDDEAEVRV